MNKVYVLQHFHEDGEYEEHPKLIGVYTSEEEAQAAIARLITQPGFRDHPKGFSIGETDLNRDGWEEGFISWDEAHASISD
jgi:hypothetical protein